MALYASILLITLGIGYKYYSSHNNLPLDSDFDNEYSTNTNSIDSNSIDSNTNDSNDNNDQLITELKEFNTTKTLKKSKGRIVEPEIDMFTKFKEHMTIRREKLE